MRIRVSQWDGTMLGAMHKLSILLVLLATVLPVRLQRGSPASLDGHESGALYANDFFEFRFKLPAGWVEAPAQMKEGVLKSLNASAPKADNHVLLMLLHPVRGESPPDVIAVFAARSSIGSTDGAAGGVAYFRSNRASERLTVIAPVRIVHLAGQRFARQDVQSKGQFLALFASVKAGYLLSFQAFAATKDRMDGAVRVLAASVQFK
ncbi:MAG TPA: hypothetical protein VKT50_10420 [Candidatus Acidoferrales bacterium]|nr:hypothetical protein [Candidatus Acidoferrales bacterium]